MFKIKRSKNKQFVVVQLDLDNSSKESVTETYTQKAGCIKYMMSVMQSCLGRGIIYIDETDKKPTYHWIDERGGIGDYRDKADWLEAKQVRKDSWEMIKQTLNV